MLYLSLTKDNLVLSCIYFIDAPEVSVTGYDGNWFVGRKGVNLKCNADANPPPFKSVWSR